MPCCKQVNKLVCDLVVKWTDHPVYQYTGIPDVFSPKRQLRSAQEGDGAGTAVEAAVGGGDPVAVDVGSLRAGAAVGVVAVPCAVDT